MSIILTIGIPTYNRAYLLEFFFEKLYDTVKLFPNKIKFEENNIYYELKSNTQYFLHSMFYICNELEKLNNVKIEQEEKQIRLFNVLPLRTNIVPKIFVLILVH